MEQQSVRQRDEEEVRIQILEGERVEVPAVDSYQLATDNALDAAKLVALKKSSSPVRSRADFDGLQKISLQCSPPHHHGKRKNAFLLCIVGYSSVICSYLSF